MTYVIIFSSIPHKEDRFLLPIYPFLILIISEYLLLILKAFNRYEKYIVKGFLLLILYEIILSLAFFKY